MNTFIYRCTYRYTYTYMHIYTHPYVYIKIYIYLQIEQDRLVFLENPEQERSPGSLLQNKKIIYVNFLNMIYIRLIKNIIIKDIKI
jgi:hypothetical protein